MNKELILRFLLLWIFPHASFRFIEFNLTYVCYFRTIQITDHQKLMLN
jgi:hypothetical protein